MYADGETETVHLCLQSFMWLDDQQGDGSGELIHNAPTVRACLPRSLSLALSTWACTL